MTNGPLGDGTSDGIVMSLQEYLQTSFHPDCDFVDGEVQERLWGEYDHATMQFALLSHFHTRHGEWQVQTLPSLRVAVSVGRVRVPDITVLRHDHPREQLIRTAPLLCIEILSPEDRFGRMDQKIADYLSMGVQAVWIIDPAAKAAYECHGGRLADWALTAKLHVSGTPIEIDVAELFHALD